MVGIFLDFDLPVLKVCFRAPLVWRKIYQKILKPHTIEKVLYALCLALNSEILGMNRIFLLVSKIGLRSARRAIAPILYIQKLWRRKRPPPALLLSWVRMRLLWGFGAGMVAQHGKIALTHSFRNAVLLYLEISQKWRRDDTAAPRPIDRPRVQLKVPRFLFSFFRALS